MGDGRPYYFSRYLLVILLSFLLFIVLYLNLDSRYGLSNQVVYVRELKTYLIWSVKDALNGTYLLKKRPQLFPDINQLINEKQLRILVTGGAGFVGSHLTIRLLQQGHIVIVLDNFISGNIKNLEPWLGHPNLQVLTHDVIVPLRLEVDQIYHLACPASPKFYQIDPIKTITTNTKGTLNMLGLAKRLKAKILLASSGDIYGNPKESPQPEAYWGNVNTLGPRACYVEGKRISETMTQAYKNQQGLDTRIARIFNTFGPNMGPFDGRVVSNFITKALLNEDIFITGSGSQTRSFQYIDDLIDGLILLMNSDFQDPVNLGSPIELSIEDLAKTIKRLTNSKSEIIFTESMLEDPSRRFADISLAASKLGWKPKVSLEDGLRKTISYFEQIKMRYNDNN